MLQQQDITSLKQSILIVDDDVELCGLMKTYLQNHSFDVKTCHHGDEALTLLLNWQPSLIVLDLMLPGADGLSICREIRHNFTGPILMFTALTEEIDEVAGLESGADDYLKKPVTPRLLLARIRTLLRRNTPTASQPQQQHKLLVDSSTRSVSYQGEEVAVTTVEFDLLHLLVTKEKQVVSRQDIFEAMRRLDYDGIDRSIDLYISRIRKKLGDDAKHPTIIKTVRGNGYLYTGE